MIQATNLLASLEENVTSLSPDEFGKYPVSRTALEIAIRMRDTQKEILLMLEQPDVRENIPARWYKTND